MFGNLLFMFLGLLGIFCGVWFLNTDSALLTGRFWDAVTGAGILLNSLVFGVNLYEFVSVDEDEE